MSPAPVQTKNSFEALEDTNIIDSNGAAIYREKIVKIESLSKPIKPMKKRRMKRGFIHGYAEFDNFDGDIFGAQSKREI